MTVKTGRARRDSKQINDNNKPHPKYEAPFISCAILDFSLYFRRITFVVFNKIRALPTNAITAEVQAVIPNK